MKEWGDECFIVQCDSHGVIQTVVRDDFAPSFPLVAGYSLLDVFDAGSRDKAASFLSEVQRFGAAQGWELDIALEDAVYTVRLQGLAMEQGIYVAGTCVLQRTADTDAGELQSLSSHLFDELSRLNNEVINAQRSLAKAQSELKQERDLLSVTLRSVQDSILSTDAQGRITLVNASAEAMLAMPSSAVRGKRLEQVLVLDEPDAQQALHRLVDSGVAIQRSVEGTLRRSDGTALPVEFSGSPIVGDSNHCGGVVISLHDTSFRKASEAEQARLLAEALEASARAERANEERLRFMAMITHDLRSPLTAIRGFSSTLLATDVAWDEATQRDFIQIIDNEATRLMQLIDELLQMAQLESSAMQIDVQRTTIQAIIDAMSGVLQRLVDDRALTFELQPMLPPILADPERVGQVLNNLVSNAAKYSPPQTEVQITAQSQPPFVKVTIHNEGEGIPREERQHVFDAFYRLQRDSSIKGTGLGLAICKGLIEAQGGRIWIEDTPAPGTAVSFTLPMDET